jgi:two-component system, LytTR family, response regulator
MKINCIAIDDEPLALDIIKDYCSKISYLNLMDTFTSPIASIDFLKSNKVDLLFLDIQMEQLTGIQLLNVIKSKPMVIFTTAYDSFAVLGYELDAMDYLLKPISFERFLKATTKAYEKFSPDKISTGESPVFTGDSVINDYFFIKTDAKMQKVNFSDVLYIEGHSDYLGIVTEKERFMTIMNFKRLEEILPQKHFVRVHKSYMVALSKIEYVERFHIKIRDHNIPIGESYRVQFFKEIENHNKL